MWWSLAKLGHRLGVDVLRADPDTIGETQLLEPIMARSRVGADALMGAPSGLVHSGAVHGWVHDRVLPDGRWRLAPPMLIDALGKAMASLATTDESERPLVLVPHRRLRLMNSQFESLAEGSEDVVAVRVHPSVAIEFGGDGALVVVETDHGSLTGRLAPDPRLRADTVTIGHGSERCNVSELTSAGRGVDALTGMPQLSGLACRLRRHLPA